MGDIGFDELTTDSRSLYDIKKKYAKLNIDAMSISLPSLTPELIPLNSVEYDTADFALYNSSMGTPISVPDSGSSLKACLIDDTHVFVCYFESPTLKAVVGVISGTTITYGSVYDFGANVSTYPFPTKIDSSHVFISYAETIATINYGRAVVATISGTDISFGTIYTYDDTFVLPYESHISKSVLLDSSHIFVSFSALNNNEGACGIIAHFVGDALDFGTKYIVPGSYDFLDIGLLSSEKVLIWFRQATEERKVVVSNISGMDISFATPSSMGTFGSSPNSMCILDTTKAVVSFNRYNIDQITQVMLVYIALDDTISFGDEHPIDSDIYTDRLFLTTIDSSHIALSFFDIASDYNMSVIFATIINNGDISFGTTIIMETLSNIQNGADIVSVLLNTGRILALYRSEDLSSVDHGKACFETLTPDSYIVIPEGIEYIQIHGGILIDISSGWGTQLDVSFYIAKNEIQIGKKVPIIKTDSWGVRTSPLQTEEWIILQMLVLPVVPNDRISIMAEHSGVGSKNILIKDSSYLQILALG